jgi:TolA-binding protein
MNDFMDELEGLIGKHRQQEAAAKQNEENEARFKRLEDGISGIGEKIDTALSSTAAAANSDASAAEKGEENPSGRQGDSPPPNPPEDENLNVERVTRSSIPKIYSGDDEPEIVQYIDAESGETMTRKGRKKNYPTQTMVEIVMPEPVNRPQEPSEEQTG